MDTIRVIADSFASAETTNPECTAFVASDKKHKVEVMIPTTKVPLACASLLISAQKGMFGMEQGQLVSDLVLNFDSSAKLVPDAVDIMRQGDVICINLGFGGLFFKLTDRAKEALKHL